MAFGDVPRPTGPAAQQLLGAQWPEMSESDLGDLAAKYVALAKGANAYGDQLMRGMTRDRELLKGHAGDAHQELMTKLRDHAYAVADHFETKAATAKAYKEIIFGLKTTLTRIAEAAEKDWKAAQPASRGVVIAKYAPEVESAVADAWSDFNAAPAPSAPPKLPVLGTPTDPGAAADNDPTIRTVENRTDQPPPPPVPDATDSEAPSGTPKVDNDSAIPDATDSEAPSGTPKVDNDSAIPDATDSEAPSGAPKVDSPITGTPGNGTGSQMPSMPAGVPSMGGSSPSVPSSSLGSASGLMKPPAGSALSGGALSGGAVSPPSAPTTPQGLGAGGSSSPLANATKSFGSGLSSGFGGATGAVPPPTMSRAEPLVSQPVAAQPGSAQPASAPSVASHGGPSAAAPAPTGGGVGGGGGMGGGGALAPFVPPGGHAPPPPPAPPSSPTAAASSAAPAGGAQPGAQQSGAGGPAMVASASGGTTAGMLPEADNPDLLVAKRVLTGLVIGTSAAPDPIVLDWAVSVLNTSMGKQVVIASSMGGGGYVPASVFLPADARLAVTDRSLPMGWAALYTGWPAPVDIVVAHSEKLSEHLAGVSISAIAATNSGQSSAYRPSGVADYLTVSLADVLKDGGTAPVFGGGFQHRMVSVDPDLARRLSMLDRGGDISTHIATQVTIAVATAAQQETPRLIDPVDLNTLSALGDGATVDWAEHYRAVCGRENNAMFYPSVVAQPSDLDESVTSVNIRAVYQHYYRMGRMVELVRCWRHSPVSVLDIGYCACAAGFGATVSEALVPWEQYFNGGGAQ